VDYRSQPKARRYFSKLIYPMNGLVMAGGLSTRMGQDKSDLIYTDKPQRQVVFELLQKYCAEVWVSCRPSQIEKWKDNLSYLPDNQVDIGPMAGLLRAFEYAPHEAWLVMACDMPWVNAEVLDFLVQNRNADKLATAFQNPQAQFPEPLLTIWESGSYEFLQTAWQNTHFSLRKLLQTLDIQLISFPKPALLRNVNTWEEYESVREELALGEGYAQN
jgi:molybdopterin-guanine dinucleotide biosynthesis protein A